MSGKWQLTCDLNPDCHDQGCTERSESCQRVLDLRAGIDRRPDLRPKCPVEDCGSIPIDCPRIQRFFKQGHLIETNPSAPCSWVKRIFMEGT